MTEHVEYGMQELHKIHAYTYRDLQMLLMVRLLILSSSIDQNPLWLALWCWLGTL